MMKLIVPDEIAFKAVISEDDLKRRIEDEVLSQVGGLDPDGKRRVGLKVKCTRGSHGGYTVEVTGPTPQHFLVPLAAPSNG